MFVVILASDQTYMYLKIVRGKTFLFVTCTFTDWDWFVPVPYDVSRFVQACDVL